MSLQRSQRFWSFVETQLRPSEPQFDFYSIILLLYLIALLLIYYFNMKICVFYLGICLLGLSNPLKLKCYFMFLTFFPYFSDSNVIRCCHLSGVMQREINCDIFLLLQPIPQQWPMGSSTPLQPCLFCLS